MSSSLRMSYVAQTTMTPPHRTAAFILFFSLLLFSLQSVWAQDPDVHVNYFHDLPARMFFFDDTTVSLPPDMPTLLQSHVIFRPYSTTILLKAMSTSPMKKERTGNLHQVYHKAKPQWSLSTHSTIDTRSFSHAIRNIIEQTIEG